MEVEGDITKSDSNNIELHKGVDFDLILSGIPKSQIHDKCFTDEVRELINNLSYIYHLDSLTMQGLIYNSINEKGFIDKTVLRKSCRDHYQFENCGNLPTLIYHKQPEYLKKPKGDHSKWAKMVYTFENITPYELLKMRYKGAEPTDRDKRLIESLLLDQKLAPGVVNVLISYVLKTQDEQLKKSYVEAIAGQWKRLNIETVEDAMQYTLKEHQKISKGSPKSKLSSDNKKETKEKNLPAWFYEEQQVQQTSEEEVEELDKILKELV